MKVLFFGHEASRTGAPMSLLRIMQWLSRQPDIEMRLLLAAGGSLEPDYRHVAETRVADLSRTVLQRVLNAGSGGRDLLRRLQNLRLQRWAQNFDPDVIYVNSTGAARLVNALNLRDTPLICRVAELEVCLREYVGLQQFEQLATRASGFVAVAQAVKRNLVERHGIRPDTIEVIHGFLSPSANGSAVVRDRQSICRELGIDPGAQIVGAVGSHLWQKSPELFVQVARFVRDRLGNKVKFVWVGGFQKELSPRLTHDIDAMAVKDIVRFVPESAGAMAIMSCFDVFALTSREDPYPLVVLEAASLAKPIVCFEGSGGAPEFVESDAGFVVPFADVEAMGSKLIALLQDEQLRRRLGQNALAKVKSRHEMETAGQRVLSLLRRSARQ